MGQIDQHEKRSKLSLGMKAINDEMVFRRIHRAKTDRRDMEEQERLKRELQKFTDEANALAKENQQLKQNLMTLRLEVRHKLLGDVNGDGAYEEIPIEKLDVNPHLFEMPYEIVRKHIRAATRKDLAEYRKESNRKQEEGSKRSILNERGDGENPGGPIPKNISKSSNAEPRFPDNFPEFADLENVPDYDIPFQDFGPEMARGSEDYSNSLVWNLMGT